MRRIGASVLGLLLPASFAAAATLSVSDIALAPGGQGNVEVRISDGGSITSYAAFAFVEDGGPGAGGTANPGATPNITGGSSITGIFAGNNTGNQFDNFGIGPLLGQLIASTNSGSVEAVGPNALLGTFQITVPAGTPVGTYTIALQDPGGSTNLNPAPASGYDLVAGTITVVPEPASALLLLGALPFLRRRSA